MTAAAKRLATAHRRVGESKTELAAAAAAAEKARSLAATLAIEVLEHVRKNEDATALRTAALKRALKTGDAPSFKKEPELAVDYVAMREAENRQSAAKQAMTELVAEQTQAQLEVDEAIAELNAAARGVISAQLDDAVSKVAALELEVMQRRADIEGLARSNVLGWGLQTAMSDAAKRLLAGNSMTDIGVKNSGPWARANEHAETWRARYQGLVENHAARRIKDHAPVATAARRIKESAPADSRVA
jgi:hypothetical protein